MLAPSESGVGPSRLWRGDCGYPGTLDACSEVCASPVRHPKPPAPRSNPSSVPTGSVPFTCPRDEPGIGFGTAGSPDLLTSVGSSASSADIAVGASLLAPTRRPTGSRGDDSSPKWLSTFPTALRYDRPGGSSRSRMPLSPFTKPDLVAIACSSTLNSLLNLRSTSQSWSTASRPSSTPSTSPST